MGNHQLAIFDFNEAIKFDDSQPDGFYYRGLSKTHMKRYKDAIKDFDDAKLREKTQIEINSNLGPNAGISDGLGRCFHALGDYERAIDNFEKAIENAVSN
jgi:tetratricopeptide (TPR) repeat protein